MRVGDALRLLRGSMSSATLVACCAAQRATVVKPGWQRHGLGLANWVGKIILPTETRYNVYRYVRCETMQRTTESRGIWSRTLAQRSPLRSNGPQSTVAASR